MELLLQVHGVFTGLDEDADKQLLACEKRLSQGQQQAQVGGDRRPRLLMLRLKYQVA